MIQKIQIAREIFLKDLATMKSILDLIAFKVDKKSMDYLYYKKEVMSYFYTNLKKLFKLMVENKLIEKCNCGANLRQGYKKCPKCSGAGYKNKEIK